MAKTPCPDTRREKGKNPYGGYTKKGKLSGKERTASVDLLPGKDVCHGHQERLLVSTPVFMGKTSSSPE